MKIFILSHSSGAENMGGAEWTLLHMIDLWRRTEPDVSFFVVARSPAGQLQPELDTRGIRHLTIPYDSWVLPLVRESPEHRILTDLMDGEAVHVIRNAIRQEQPDLVLTNTIVSPWAAFAAKLEGLPHAWFVHEYGDLDHGLGFRIGREATFADIAVLSELVFANSEAVRDHITSWVPPEKVVIAYPPIEIKEEQAPHQPGQAGDRDQRRGISLVMVGRISRSKGQWRLVQAVDRLVHQDIPVRVTFVGYKDSFEGLDLERDVRSRGLSDLITFVGEQADPGRYVREADVAVMASDNEAFGRVTVEYMASGKPVIASNTGANPELVVDGDTGWLFDKDSVDSLCNAIRDAASNPVERVRRGNAGRRRAYDVILRKYPLADAINRMQEVVAKGPSPMPRLPSFLTELLEHPGVVETYISDRRRLWSEVTSSRTWRLGELALAVPRPIRRLLKLMVSGVRSVRRWLARA